MTDFLLIRHGETDAIGKYIAGWRPGVGLTPAGEAQARALVDRLRDAPLAAVYCSPLERTRRTAEPLARARGLPVQLTDDLGEVRYGEWEGRRFEDLRALPLWRQYNAFRSGTRIPGGELQLEVQTRAVALLERLGREHAAHCVALFSHADVIKCLVLHYLGMPLDFLMRLEVSPASITRLRIEPHGPVLLSFNET